MRRIRCAIYTRKSSESGLEQDFNSLDAQREACEAYIASQTHEGWILCPDRYEDGGISGGHLDRPALRRLMQEVEARRIDQIVVYKIDRLTRSLADFAKLVETLDAAEASFVSVTQSFNTGTSMGRLTLNVLLSFAQFEREVTAERIRDKIAASKQKGLWMGGLVPLGYQAEGRSLKIDETEAATVRMLYKLYQQHGCLRETRLQAAALGLRSRVRERADGRAVGGLPFSRGHLYHILRNPVYVGRIRHKGRIYDGLHPAIIAPVVWEDVQRKLQDQAGKARGGARKTAPSPLIGKLFDETGDRLTPSHSTRKGRRSRYYVSHRLITGRSKDHPDGWRLPAEPLERVLVDLIDAHLSSPRTAALLLRDQSAARLASASEKFAQSMPGAGRLAWIERVDLRPGALIIELRRESIAALAGCACEDLQSDGLQISSPFQMRRRGVEVKLHLGEETKAVDLTLVRNVVTAKSWLKRIIAGQSVAEIAGAENTSRRRVQDVIDLALLAPSVLEAIATGAQPAGLTTDYLIKTGVPPVWANQIQKFADL
ncbi:recombinase family protein [Aestuariibius insulae]|uniref:recombinase family protein n=1 Tax=Aestuariibius insulae TaxID=2058287 RepID=UPI00345E5D4D